MDFTKAKKLIEEHEGLRLEAYNDPIGIWTIGYGHTSRDVVEGLKITMLQADQLLAGDIDRTVEQLRHHMIFSRLNENQANAVVSFVFNIGIGKFIKSTMVSDILLGKPAEDIAKQFGKWVYAGDKILDGLIARRQAEKALFLEV